MEAVQTAHRGGDGLLRLGAASIPRKNDLTPIRKTICFKVLTCAHIGSREDVPFPAVPLFAPWRWTEGEVAAMRDDALTHADETLDIHGAARQLGVHAQTVRRLARRNEIPAFKVGEVRRFSTALFWSCRSRSRASAWPRPSASHLAAIARCRRPRIGIGRSQRRHGEGDALAAGK